MGPSLEREDLQVAVGQNRVRAQVRRRQAVPNQVVVATLEADQNRVEAQVHIAVLERVNQI